MSPKNFQKIQFQMHPRIFEALGTKLVTNDVVAIIELVKNSYDALATRVDVIFEESPDQGLRLHIIDNGTGMSNHIIENVWSVVATPFRKDGPINKSKSISRRVSGEKGLGRLSAARLGSRLELYTKANRQQCFQLDLDWDELAGSKNLSECEIEIRPCNESKFPVSGTELVIGNLRSEWTPPKFQELQEQLSRLVSPFGQVEDFEIWFRQPSATTENAVVIKPAEFINYPPYQLKGSVDSKGQLQANYEYSFMGRTRKKMIKKELETIQQNRKSYAGPFEFELRVWDLDSDSIQQIAKRYDATRTTIREDIRNYRGISVYRDGILALPKTETNRDWSGLDLRRVSRVGNRISTSQLVGYIAISADANMGLMDTSDREGLEENPSYEEFKKLVRQIVDALEKERAFDRDAGGEREPPFRDLFHELSADNLVRDVQELAGKNVGAAHVLPLVESHQALVQNTIQKIERRLYYYSRLASLGILSLLIVHEVRNHTTVLGSLISHIKENDIADDDMAFRRKVSSADESIDTLDRLAERFAPLASRGRAGRRRDSILEKIVNEAIGFRENEIKKRGIVVELPNGSETTVAIDPAELITVILNLLDNSIYWLSKLNEKAKKTIKISVKKQKNESRAIVRVDDSGPGIEEGDEERIFWPGVTRKPDGIGMGLTVASEIISQYRGRLALVKPGYQGGASFTFDLPLID